MGRKGMGKERKGWRVKGERGGNLLHGFRAIDAPV